MLPEHSGFEILRALRKRSTDPRGRRIGGRRIDPRTLGDDVRLVQVDRGRSDTSLALSVGGGVDFALWKGLAVGPNITFMKLFGDSSDVE
jgi:hypothetical protein